MIKSELGSLACRLMALWLFVQVAANLATAALGLLFMVGATSRWDSPGGTVVILFSCLPQVVLFLIGIFLWRRAEAIGQRLAPSQNPDATVGSFTAQDALSVGFAVLGMYLLLIAIPELGRQLATLQVTRVPFSEAWSSPRWQVGFWVNLFQIGLGIWLLMGARGIARAVRTLQRPDATDVDSPQV